VSHRKKLRAAIGCFALLIAGAGCGSQHVANVDWPSWGNTQENTHFASIGQVNGSNVAHLRLVWERSEGPGQSAWETFPEVVGTTMYYTTDTDEVLAVDAATGRLRWSYVPRVDFLAGPAVGNVEPVSRGVAVGDGRVYVTTTDDQLIALGANSGRLLWHARIDDPDQGYAETSPGTYWHGELILGGPAGDAGLRGFVAAFDARTGRRLWRTYTVPAPGHGWMPARGAQGGGDVWMPPVVDPQSATVYVATGDPRPAFSAASRPGCDRWADATVALDARTGALKWGHTEVCNDSWDYDTDQAPVLFDVRLPRRTVRVVGDGSKAGFYTTLDARTGAPIARTPELVPYSRPHRAPTRSGTVVCPGTSGGLGYGPSAYSPRTRDLYVLGIDMCMRYTIRRDLDSATPVGAATGLIVSVDPTSGRIVWRDRLPRPAVGGALATAGGLVFAGDDDGRLYAFGANTGRILWRVDLGLRFGSAPIAYEIGGREFIAVAAGGSLLTGDGARGGGELFVFGLSPHP
jgi:alcohol dehydrogenase (cytochrome c)